MSDPAVALESLPIVVHAQYIKDMSFENPDAATNLRIPGSAPDMNVSVNLEVKNIPDDKIPALFEVTLQFRIRAMRDDHAMFLVDLDYAVMASVDRVPEANRHAVLLIDVPKLGFPFARQILADLTQSGGFPPVLLTPLDFTTLYIDRFGKKTNETRP